MKVSIDRDADVLYIAWGDGGGAGEEVAPGIYLTYNNENQPVGLEVLYLSQRTKSSLEHLMIAYAHPGSSEQEPPTAQEFAIEFQATAHHR